MRLTPAVLLLLLVLACDAALAAPASFRAGPTQTTLLELYTSEGCSSCPPADRWLSAWVDDSRLWQEVVPVAFHVDYWDDLGWQDSYASNAASNRQRTQAGHSAAGVYTPEFIVDGHEWRGWFDGATLPRATANVGNLEVRMINSAVEIQWRPLIPGTDFIVHVAVLGSGINSAIARGENAGRQLRHDFVVLADTETALDAHDRQFDKRLALPVPTAPTPRRALAVWIEDAASRRPLQATGGWLD